MGRHSAGSDDEDADVPVVVAAETAAARRGRHTRTEDTEETGPVDTGEVRSRQDRGATQDEQPTERIPLDDLLFEDQLSLDDVAETEPVPSAEVPREEPPRKRPARGSQSTAADLALLRRHPEIRARVLAAVVVPFVLYVAILLLVGATGIQYLIWIWIPAVTAGVLGGLILDAAHRHRPASPPLEDGASGG